MSVFIVRDAHLDVIVNAAAQHNLISTGTPAATRRAMTEVGRMLRQANHDSATHSEQQQDRAGEPPAAAAGRYRVAVTGAELDPVVVLKALDCFVYQCDGPGWDDSPAAALERLLRQAIYQRHPDLARPIRLPRAQAPAPSYRATPAYHRAPWHIDSLDQAQPHPDSRPERRPR
jgi:hypothetical protein